MKPTVPEVLPLVRDYYAGAWGRGGGVLHIFLEDGNHLDSDIQYCLDRAREEGDSKAIVICELLLRMSKTQRLKIYNARRE